MKNLTGTELSQMSISELEKLFSQMKTPTPEQKEKAWKRMDTGIYDKDGNIIGDKCYEEEKGKRRPAIVVDYKQTSTRVIVLKVTTQGVRTVYDYPLSEPQMPDLSIGSVVRYNHTLTLPNEFKCEKHGNLSRKDAMTVELLYNQALF